MKKKHILEGLWHSPEWSSVELRIKRFKTTLQIKAVDALDGERLQVKNIDWDETMISFDLFTPSTGHVCHHVVTYTGKNRAVFQITWSEKWILKKEKANQRLHPTPLTRHG
jgi:hypothetical protein